MTASSTASVTKNTDGVVCDVVFTTSEAAKDEIFLRQINDEIARISSELDKDRNGGQG